MLGLYLFLLLIHLCSLLLIQLVVLLLMVLVKIGLMVNLLRLLNCLV